MAFQFDEFAKILQLRQFLYLAFLWISTVLQVLSAAWQMFSSGQSAHLGRRAMHSLRPCQMIWWENRVHFSRGMILHQVLLDLLRVVVAREFEAAADAVDVCIHDHAFVLLEPCAQDDVGGLARHSGQSEKLVHLIGDLAAEITHDLFCRAHHRLRFVPEKAGGADVRLELFGRERRKILRPWDIF